MISKELAMEILNAHLQIEDSLKLLSYLNEVLKKNEEKNHQNLYNVFGERKGLQLAVPDGSIGHRIFDVSPSLSIKIIEEHIAMNEKRLEELMDIALSVLKYRL